MYVYTLEKIHFYHVWAYTISSVIMRVERVYDFFTGSVRSLGISSIVSTNGKMPIIVLERRKEILDGMHFAPYEVDNI